MMENTEAQQAKTLEALLNRLESQITNSRSISIGLITHAESLEQFHDGEGLKSEGDAKAPSGYLPKLAILIDELTEINSTNSRTLTHLNKLI